MSSSSSLNTRSVVANIKGILQEGGTPQCSVWAELYNGESFHQTIHRDPQHDTSSSDYERNDTVLYGIGSLTKIFVAYAFVILIERLAKSDDPNCERFRDLRDAWDKGLRMYLDIALPWELTLDNLLSHYRGLPSLNDFLFGPDGTVLSTIDEFPKIAEQIALEEHQNNPNIPVWRYNNSGYILAGIIIEKYSGGSLAEFLEENIFRPFNMTSTCVDLQRFERLPQESISRPHIVSTDVSAQVVEFPKYFNTPAFAAMGIYSCTKDLAAFFRRLLYMLDTQSVTSNQDLDIIGRFLFPFVVFQGDRGSYSFCGHHTNLSTTHPGRGSLNRQVTASGSDASTYTLGVGPEGAPLDVIHGSGIITGYECCFYFMEEAKGFVIVLSNATGLVDASDHISRFLVQEFWDLKYKTSKVRRLTGKRKIKKIHAVDVIEKSRVGAQERRQYIENFISLHISQEISIFPADFIGHYANSKFRQHILISCNDESALYALICGSAGCSKPFQVVPIDKVTVRLLPLASERLPFLSVDVFADWSSLDLVIGKNDSGAVTYLTRTRANFSVIYSRTSDLQPA